MLLHLQAGYKPVPGVSSSSHTSERRKTSEAAQLANGVGADHVNACGDIGNDAAPSSQLEQNPDSAGAHLGACHVYCLRCRPRAFTVSLCPDRTDTVSCKQCAKLSTNSSEVHLQGHHTAKAALFSVPHGLMQPNIVRQLRVKPRRGWLTSSAT